MPEVSQICWLSKRRLNCSYNLARPWPSNHIFKCQTQSYHFNSNNLFYEGVWSSHEDIWSQTFTLQWARGPSFQEENNSVFHLPVHDVLYGAIQVPPFSGPSPLQALPRLHHRRHEMRISHLTPTAILRADHLVLVEVLGRIVVTARKAMVVSIRVLDGWGKRMGDSQKA